MVCVRGKNVYYDDFYLSGKYFYMIYKNVVIIMWCFGFYWCKVMKEIILLLVCYKYFVKKEKKKKRELYVICVVIIEKWKMDEIKIEYEKIV